MALWRHLAPSPSPAAGAVPRWLKLAYGGFLCVLVPAYWRAYGPGNFLWLSDIGLGATAAAAIAERPALAEAMAVGLLPLETAWSLDFAAGGKLLGISGYMFEPDRPRFLRALSLFHLALPPTWLWMMRRFGYDRRSLRRHALVTAAALPLAYALTAPEANVNWVFGPGRSPQRRLPPRAYLALEMAALALLVQLPMHRLLCRRFPPTPRS
jgi:hypothetical protein